ncbi:hypothetical protein IFR05_010561 [Cadophora sp. M221]|nr:hypothetical protein IFR05_010561 [Cadophora sp. M221]
MTSLANDMQLILTKSIRVVRNLTKPGDLIAIWPSLKTKVLESPSTLTDLERRLFFDLPDEDTEAATPKPQRISPNRFWTPRTEAEISGFLKALSGASEAVIEEFYEIRALGNEDAAFIIGTKEYWRRSQASENIQLEVAAKAALPYAEEWIQLLYHAKEPHWGFVCFWDASVRELEPGKIELLENRLEEFFRHALMYNGSAEIIDKKWRLLYIDALKSALALGLVTDNYQGATGFREAFREILTDPQGYQNKDDVTFRRPYAYSLKNGVATSGLLTNFFLVTDRTCMNSTLTDAHFPLYDDMRILAFEANYPVPGRQYIEGYKGFTWVRLDQLVYNFCELRSMKAEKIGMDEIWKAGQESKHQVFIVREMRQSTLYEKGVACESISISTIHATILRDTMTVPAKAALYAHITPTGSSLASPPNPPPSEDKPSSAALLVLEDVCCLKKGRGTREPIPWAAYKLDAEEYPALEQRLQRDEELSGFAKHELHYLLQRPTDKQTDSDS